MANNKNIADEILKEKRKHLEELQKKFDFKKVQLTRSSDMCDARGRTINEYMSES